MKHWPRTTTAAAVLLLLMAGCGNPKPKPVTVSGAVTVDGQPLAAGDISFYSSEGRPPETAKVSDGSYSLTLIPGHRRVEIRAYRKKLGPISTSAIRPEDPLENYIPAAYNSSSTLKADIELGKENNFPFELKTK